jgi:hypothetical protein
MIIYGAGMAGLLAANMFRRFNPTVCEQKESLPHNHEALLRFRSNDVSIATGIPFKKVYVHKAIKYGNKIETIPNLFYSNLYSGKVTGAYLDRSINNLDSAARYISPLNFVELMAQGANIIYNTSLDHSKCLDARYGIKNDGDSFPLITTIPMPMMMDIVGWEKKPIFNYKTIWSQKTIIEDPEVCVNQTIYYPDPKTNFYRISITDNVVIAEYIIKPTSAGPEIMGALREDFGINALKLSPIAQIEMQFGKLLPINEKIRKEFIVHLTTNYNIFSVGRFATWRQLLLDDIVQDIKIVEGLMGDAYKIKLQSKKGKKDA